MGIAEVLEVGQEVGVIIQGSSRKYNCAVKKIKGDLVAVSLTEVKDKEEVSVGKKVAISWDTSEETSYKAKGSIIQNKVFPIVVARLGDVIKKSEEKKEEGKEKEDVDESFDPEFDRKYVKETESISEDGEAERDSARVEDAFPIQFFVPDQETVRQEKNDYLSRRTRERRSDSQVSTEFKENEVLEKIANSDPGVIEVITDLYRKYYLLANKVFKKEDKESGGKNMGTCVDLSGSGLQFLTKQQIKPKTILKFMINPPATPPFSISALGEVMRVERKKDPTDRKTKYAYGARFYAIHEDDQEEIIQYTFKRQQEMLKQRRRKAGYD